MTVYKGSQKIKDIYFGKTKIGKIYRGSQLLYTSLAYPLDTVVFEKTAAGTYNVALEKGKYEVYCIAGGAGGWGRFRPDRFESFGGGSGSGFIGIINMVKGTYSITVGKGGGARKGNPAEFGSNSSIGNLVITYGGQSNYYGGPGGATPTVNTMILQQTLNKSGNAGAYGQATSKAGGAAVYMSYGKGGDGRSIGSSQGGYTGYVKIVYKGN